MSNVTNFKKDCETIERNLAEAGAALERIRDTESWRGQTYKGIKITSWTEFCRSMEMSQQSVWRRIEAGKVARENPGIKTINQAMEHRKLALPTRRIALPAASGEQTDSPEPTKQLEPPAKLPARRIEAKPMLDKTGVPIPTKLIEFWNRNEEVEHLLKLLKVVRHAVEKGKAENDRLFRRIDFPGTITRLKQCEEELASAVSYAVCPECNGHFNDNCQTCKGRGSLGKFWWDMQPEEIRELRETAN